MENIFLWFFGEFDGLLCALLVFAIIDFIAGIMCAVVNKKLSSALSVKDIFKKILIFALVGIAHILDTQVIGTGAVLRTAVILFYLSNEGVSLIQKIDYLDLIVPKGVKVFLNQLRDHAEKKSKYNDDD